MSDIDDLIASLAFGQAQKQLVAEADPYSGGASVADAISNLAVSAGPQYKTRDKIILGALSGLTGGLFSGASQDYQNRAQDAYTSSVMGLSAGKDIAKPSVLSDALFSGAKQQSNLFKLRQALTANDLAQKLGQETKLAEMKGEQDLKAEVAKELIKNPRRAQQLAPVIQSLFGAKGGAAMPAQALAAPTETEITSGASADQSPLLASPQQTPATKDPALGKVLGILGGNFGEPESIEDKQVRIAQRFQDEGATPGEAWSQAGKQLDADRIALKASTKKVEDVREAANQALQMADTAQLGIEGAGETGGLLGGVRNLASKAAALVNPEQQQKQASQTLLDSVRPQIVQTMRSPGAISDFESRMLIGAGPSSSNTPEANAEIVSKIRGVAQLNNEYADYLDWYRERMGTVTGADKVWQSYKKDNPLVLQDESGKGSFNTDRQSIFDWLTLGPNNGGNGSGGGAPVPPQVQTTKSKGASQVNRPTWGESARFVGKSLAEGVGNTLGLVADLNPFDPQNSARIVTNMLGSDGGTAPSETIKKVVTSIAGSPDDEGITGSPSRVVRSALNAVAFPGAPVANALAGAGAGIGSEVSDSAAAPIVGAIAGGSIPSIAKGVSSLFTKSGKAFDRSSIGALAKNFTKSQKDKGLLIDEEAGQVSTRLSKAIEEIADNKGFGFWRDPESLAVKNAEALDDLGGKIGSAIQKAEAKGVLPLVDFSSETSAVSKVINGAKAEKGQMRQAFDEFFDRFTNPQDGWDGNLSSLNSWKSSIGNMAFSGSAQGSLTPQVARKLQRAIYSDLDKAVASTVEKAGVVKPSAWKDTLRQYSNHKEIEPIIAETVAKGETDTIAKIARGLLRTSGGTLTTPTAIGGIIGGATGGIGGLAAGAALGSLGSPTVQGVVAQGLKGAGKAAGVLGSQANLVPAAIAGSVVPQQQDDIDLAMSQARANVQPQSVATLQPMETEAMPINPIVSEFEGGQQLEAYPPPARGSGVTVATGIDLGQRSLSELKSLGLSEPLIKKITPYLGKKDADARTLVKKKPLILTQEEADELDNIIAGSIGAEVNKKFMEATGQDIALLPSAAQTVIASLAHNFGPNLDKKIPTIWKAIVLGDWATVQDKLRNTKWKQPELALRRNREAEILSELV